MWIAWKQRALQQNPLQPEKLSPHSMAIFQNLLADGFPVPSYNRNVVVSLWFINSNMAEIVVASR